MNKANAEKEDTVDDDDDDKTDSTYHVNHPHKDSMSRKEGWTESFGAWEVSSSDSTCCCWDLEDEYAALHFKASPSSFSIYPIITTNTVTIVQHRVAWQEQLILRILHIPYTVANSNRFYTEATGPLPYLIHAFGNSETKEEAKLKVVGKNNGDVHNNNNNNNDVGDERDNKNRISIVMIGKYESNPSSDMGFDSSSSKDTIFSSNQTHNAIIDYLLSLNTTNVDTQKQRQDIINSLSNIQDHLYIHWIQQYLQPILELFRYGHEEMWKQVYQKQCIQAFTSTTTTSKSIPMDTKSRNSYSSSTTMNYMSIWKQWLGRFQAMVECTIAFKNISHHFQSVQQQEKDISSHVNHDGKLILNHARNYYSVLNTVLSTSSSSPSTSSLSSHGCTLGVYYQSLLEQQEQQQYVSPMTRTKNHIKEDRNTPSYLVILLFSHLADALCNVHLVPILAEFPHLITFFQSMYTLYFGIEDNNNNNNNMDNKDKKKEQDIMNSYMNSINVFQPIPSCDLTLSTNSFVTSGNKKKWSLLPWSRLRYSQQLGGLQSDYIEAIHIMHRVAIHSTQDFSLVLDKVAYDYQQEMMLRCDGSNNLYSTSNKTIGRRTKSSNTTTYKTEGDSSESHAQNQMQKLIQEARKKDQVWISSVIACTVVGYLLTAFKSSPMDS